MNSDTVSMTDELSGFIATKNGLVSPNPIEYCWIVENQDSHQNPFEILLNFRSEPHQDFSWNPVRSPPQSHQDSSRNRNKTPLRIPSVFPSGSLQNTARNLVRIIVSITFGILTEFLRNIIPVFLLTKSGFIRNTAITPIRIPFAIPSELSLECILPLNLFKAFPGVPSRFTC